MDKKVKSITLFNSEHDRKRIYTLNNDQIMDIKEIIYIPEKECLDGIEIKYLYLSIIKNRVNKSTLKNIYKSIDLSSIQYSYEDDSGNYYQLPFKVNDEDICLNHDINRAQRIYESTDTQGNKLIILEFSKEEI